MLGFMNRKAFEKPKNTGKVTFYSRVRQKLWTKGETSGNFLDVKEILIDCDSDTILIKAIPAGAVCHTGADTCFEEKNTNDDFLFELEKIISDRKKNPTEKSYTSKLFAKGINKIAQKVGEEAVELVIEAKDSDDELFKAEAADLLISFYGFAGGEKYPFERSFENARKQKKIILQRKLIFICNFPSPP